MMDAAAQSPEYMRMFNLKFPITVEEVENEQEFIIAVCGKRSVQITDHPVCVWRDFDTHSCGPSDPELSERVPSAPNDREECGPHRGSARKKR